jgi:hypothetical protein
LTGERVLASSMNPAAARPAPGKKRHLRIDDQAPMAAASRIGLKLFAEHRKKERPGNFSKVNVSLY